MAIPNNIDFAAFDTLTATQMDDLIENDNALAAGTAFNNNAIQAPALATNAIKLGYTQITSNFTTSSASVVQVTGLTSTVTVPAGGRTIKITAYTPLVALGGSPKTAQMEIWDGTVGSGTRLNYTFFVTQTTNYGYGMQVVAVVTPAAGSKTYNVGLMSDQGGGTLATLSAAATSPSFILVEAM